MNYSQLLWDCWAYGSSYLPLCGLPTWAASLLPSLGGNEVIPMGSRRFRVLQGLGEGGYAVVYLVSELATSEHTHPDPEPRALKRVLIHSKEHFDAVQQEMLVHSAVQHHPNILPLLDYSCSEGGVGGATTTLSGTALVSPPAPLPPPQFPGVEPTAAAPPQSVDVGFAVPNSVAVSAAPGQDRMACFLFPVFHDGTLASELERLGGTGKMLPTAEVLSIFGQLAKAAAHIHAHGYAHRDIKPLNVLITVNPDCGAWQQRQQQQVWLTAPGRINGCGRAQKAHLADVEEGVALTATSPGGSGGDAGYRYRCVLMDFGSARSRAVQVAARSQALQIQEDCEAHCSAPYRAPELFDVPSPAPLDFAAADVWALGASLFQIMYGEPPFARAMNAAGGSLSLAVINCAIGWPRPPAPAYPAELHQLVQAAMAPEPSVRPSAAQLADRAADLALQSLPDAAPQAESAGGRRIGAA